MPKTYFYRPVKPFVVNQFFGENQACVDIATGKIVITADGNNPPKGYKSLYGPGGHKGLDLRAKHNQPVYCALDGTVYKIDTNEKTGLDVKVESTIDGRKFRHVYEHLLGYQPKVGDFVKAGDLIGWADNTGWSAGDHLHWQVEEFIGEKWVPINPFPLTSPTHAQDVRTLSELLARLADLLADKLRG